MLELPILPNLISVALPVEHSSSKREPWMSCCQSMGALLAELCPTVLFELPVVLPTGFIARALLPGLLRKCIE